MSEPLKSTISNWSLQAIAIVFLMIQMGCTYSPSSRSENERWTDLTTLVDGAIEIQVAVPIPNKRQESWEGKTSFVGTEANEFSDLFILGYDQGYGGLSGADTVSFYGLIYRVEKQGDTSQVSFEDIYQWIYSDRPEVMRDRKYIGKETFGDKEWYRVDYVGEHPISSSIYFYPIDNNYIFSISMRVFGENAEETHLYKQRFSDLKKLLASVKITVADFANQNKQ